MHALPFCVGRSKSIVRLIMTMMLFSLPFFIAATSLPNRFTSPSNSHHKLSLSLSLFDSHHHQRDTESECAASIEANQS